MASPKSSRLVKAILIVLPAAAFVGVLAAAVTSASGTVEPGDEAPAFAAPLLDESGVLELESLRGTPVVLNFWASWCGPCIEEAPMLSRAWREYGDRVEFVGVDIRDARSDALAFVAQTGLGYVHIRDEDLEIYDDYGLTGQPETFFIDDEGVVVEHVNGPLFEDTLFRLLDILVSRDD